MGTGVKRMTLVGLAIGFIVGFIWGIIIARISMKIADRKAKTMPH